MNIKKHTVLVAAGALFFLSEMFPPWVYEDSSTSVRRPAGYHRAGRPPAVKSPAEMRRLFGIADEHGPRYFAVQRDMLRLYLQRLVLLFSTPGLLLLLVGRRTRPKTVLGALCLLAAFACAALWVLVHPPSIL